MEKAKEDPVDLEIIVRDEPAGHKSELRLWLRLLSTVNMITQEIRQRLRAEFAITLPQFDLLAQLDRERDGLRMGDLSKRMMVSNGNVTGVVSRLIEDGFVTRTVDREDRRSATVRLTRKGRESFLKMAAANERWMDDMFADLSHAQIEELMRLLSHVRRSIDSHPA